MPSFPPLPHQHQHNLILGHIFIHASKYPQPYKRYHWNLEWKMLQAPNIILYKKNSSLESTQQYSPQSKHEEQNLISLSIFPRS